MRKNAKNMLRGLGVFLSLSAVALGAVTLRFAVFAPELLNSAFRAIGG